MVIPSFNMCDYLHRTLESLAAQTEPGVMYEIVVVDDGSSDATGEVCETWSLRLPNLHRVFRGRDEASCRALARNTGMREARGDWLIFLDAGVVVPSRFVVDTLDVLSPGDVLIFETLGLFASMDDFQTADAYTADDIIDAVRNMPNWRDRRVALFDRVDADLSRYAAPELLAWTCALGVERSAALSIGGFDESFRQWGAEDVEFAFRLRRAGKGFRPVRHPVVVHLPHLVPPDAEKAKQHRSNLRHLHASAGSRETEIFFHTGDGFAPNLLTERLDRLEPSLSLPPKTRTAYPLLGPDDRLCRLIVFPDPAFATMVEYDRPGHTLVTYNRRQYESFSRSFPSATLTCAVGLSLPYPDACFDEVLLFDAYRLFPPEIRAAQLVELKRVGRCLTLLLTADEAACGVIGRLYRECEGFSWPSVASVLADLSAAGLVIRERARSEMLDRVVTVAATSPTKGESIDAYS